MFPGEKAKSWEPHKVRKLKTKSHIEHHGINGQRKPVEVEDDAAYEEDLVSDEGAVWPITAGRITDWPCFFALMHYIHNTLNPPFHTPILLIAQPAWTHRDMERLAQFFFEKFKTPAFTIMDAAQASIYAYGLQTATVIDVGVDKADVTAVVDFLVQDAGRSVAIPGCGGEAMTQRLLELLGPKGLSREMCEQLKKSPICEILPPSTSLPGSSAPPESVKPGNPAAAASTGADDSGSNQRYTAASMGGAPRGPGQNTDAGTDDQQKEEDDNEGVLDVASIVASGKMNEFLERKEREKAEKSAAKKKGSDAGHVPPKPVRLRNAEREQNTFYYEDHALLDALKGSKLDSNGVAEAQATLDEGPQKTNGSTSTSPNGPQTDSTSPISTNAPPSGSNANQDGSMAPSPIRRELTVGTERFLCATGPILPTLTSAIYRTVLSVPSPTARVALWDSLIIVGAGAAVRGFKDALVASLNARFLISPSSATMFTSEIPSATSTPGRTGTNTPQPDGMRMAGGHGQGVNPLLYAATTASAQQLQLPSFTPGHLHPTTAAAVQMAQHHHQQTQSSQVYGHSQTPTSIKLAKLPEYFPEWKDVGPEESTAFLGAQVAAKVLFVVDQGQTSGIGAGKGYMTRSDYNEQGPGCVHDYIV